jgi:hypothetical protein
MARNALLRRLSISLCQISSSGLLLLLCVGCSKTRELPVAGSTPLSANGAAAPSQAQGTPPANTPKALQGSFIRVAKRASGSARFAVTLEGQHQLVLENVEVDAADPVHVYLVAQEDAPTTASVEATEDKYDVGVLNAEAPVQRFDLPSAPDAKLRVVVLWNVRYGVNLAQARLR